MFCVFYIYIPANAVLLGLTFVPELDVAALLQNIVYAFPYGILLYVGVSVVLYSVFKFFLRLFKKYHPPQQRKEYAEPKIS